MVEQGEQIDVGLGGDRRGVQVWRQNNLGLTLPVVEVYTTLLYAYARH